MHKVIEEIRGKLEAIRADIEAKIPTNAPASKATNIPQLPNITREELLEYLEELTTLIAANKDTSIGVEAATNLTPLVARLENFRTVAVPHLWNAQQSTILAFLFTMDVVRRHLTKAFKEDVNRQLTRRQKSQLEALTGFEARQNGMTDRISNLEEMLTRIEQAHDAATQLPETLENLKSTNGQISKALTDSTKKLGEIESNRASSIELIEKIRNLRQEADQVLNECHTAYSSATSQGLAKAFTDRSNELKATMFFWVGGLTLALLIGGYVGGSQLNSLIDLFRAQANANVITANIVLAVISIGAPVWFAWLSTRQVGQNFRLAEDYAFKASVSSAYEGYRRETEKFKGSGLPQKLLESALTRLDEEPLRVINDNTPGSPLHDLLNSDAIKKAAESIPGFTKSVIDLAQESLQTFTTGSSSKGKKEPTAGE